MLQKPLAESKPFPSEPTRLAEQGQPGEEAGAVIWPSPPSLPPRPLPPLPTVKSTSNLPPTIPESLAANAVVLSNNPESSVVRALRDRQEQYRQAALKAKEQDKARAIRFMKIYKVQCAREGHGLVLV